MLLICIFCFSTSIRSVADSTGSVGLAIFRFRFLNKVYFRGKHNATLNIHQLKATNNSVTKQASIGNGREVKGSVMIFSDNNPCHRSLSHRWRPIISKYLLLLANQCTGQGASAIGDKFTLCFTTNDH